MIRTNKEGQGERVGFAAGSLLLQKPMEFFPPKDKS